MNIKKISNKDNCMSNSDLSEIDVVILCGGLGKRLRSIISEQPKALVKIGEHTLLDILINNVSFYGAKNIILCIGHLKDHIKRHFDYYCSDCHNGHNHHYGGYNIVFSEEDNCLGTGGALKNAKSLIRSNHFIVMNGDSICNINFREFFDFHVNKGGLLSMVVAKSSSASDYGSIVLNGSQEIISFNEKISDSKDSNKESLINAGIYIMRKDIFCSMPRQDIFSLEYNLFPRIIYSNQIVDINNRCYGFLTDHEVIDIGTPERYKRATKIITELPR